MAIDVPRVLLIDSYDSFTYNLAALVKRAIPSCSIHIIKNDDFNIAKLLPFLKHFSAVVVGPGPGSPQISKDIGVVRDLWTLQDEDLLPIFGVCLGLQSLALAFGGTIHRLPIVKHGQISHIYHDNDGIFEGVGQVEAVRYHSLHATLLPEGDLLPIAWAHDEPANGRIVMAATHRTLPFWAVQYHPESVRTNGGGCEVVANFWRIASQWARSRGRISSPWTASAAQEFGHSWPYYSPSTQQPSTSTPAAVQTNALDLPKLTVTAVCELLGSSDEEIPFALLDSAAHPGRFSIIGCPTESSPQFTYYLGSQNVGITRGGTTTQESMHGKNIWTWLSDFMRQRKAHGGTDEIPFWAGLLGMMSYEVGLGRLDVEPLSHTTDPSHKHPHPDVNLIFVERSIVMDHSTGKIYVQSVIPDDGAWITECSHSLRQSPTLLTTLGDDSISQKPSFVQVDLPDKAEYKLGIERAMEHLFSGDSYELCLTAPTRIYTSPQSSWSRYKTLREQNAAPHSAFIRLKPTTFLSSSPERFLSYSRPPDPLCQLRPIKGTIRKGPGIDRAYADKALAQNPKEVAENLMIVDLIRHDLHSVVGEDVQVTQFCGVEEYKTVWQLVSVIEGRLGHGASDADGQLGWRALQATLPPGSMTGAPKKRSVEILQRLEKNDRSMYSGVFGYWCIGGSGDWAVTIRTCFKHDDLCTPEGEEWIIGAGGAITALSDPEAEWDEMMVKLSSVSRVFGDS